MKSTRLTLILFLFMFSAWGKAIVKPVVVSSATTLKPLKVFISLKKEYKQLQLSSLPMVGNKIDIKEIIVSSSSVDKRVVLPLSAIQKRLLKKIIINLKNNNHAAVKKDWGLLILKFNNQTMPVDINQLINYILNESILESNKDLKFYAAKMNHFQNMKEQVRSHLKNLREIRASHMVSTDVINDLSSAISDMEDKLDEIGDDAQLANIDLQNMLQKQQQVVQMLSNVSKVLHDTALAVIRKIG